jgi:Major Facilitator Superfamily
VKASASSVSSSAAASLQRLALSGPAAAWVPPAAVLLGTGWGANQFSPMLLVYRGTLGLSTGTLEAMFGLYALGLIPGLLLAGPLSDARGRRPVVIPAALLSLVASVVVIAGGHAVALLFAGRLLAGVSSGAVFSAGTAWLRESSLAGAGDTARRAAIAMTAGFGLGPLVAGLLAQWAPAPTVVPYLPHVAIMVGVLALLRGAPETVDGGAARRPLRLSFPGARRARFRRVVAPMAPWVFAAPAIAFALLPNVVGADKAADGIALGAVITAATALSGVLVQPLARRLDAAGRGNRAATVGMLVLAAGLAFGALIAQVGVIWLLLPSAIVLGSAYGMTLVAGLVEIQRMAQPGELAGLTANYYALTYVGFAAPYLLALAANFAAYPTLLAIAAALALATAALVTRAAA